MSKNVTKLLKDAVSRIRAEDYKKAMRLLEEAERLPSTPEIKQLIEEQKAACCFYADDVEGSIESLKKALEREESLDLLNLVTVAYDKRGGYDEYYLQTLRKIREKTTNGDKEITKKIVKYYTDKGDLSALDAEIDELRKKGVSETEFLPYYFAYYIETNELRKAYDYYRRYCEETPPDKRDRDFYLTMAMAFTNSVYAEAFTDDEIVEMIKQLYSQITVVNKNVLTLENARLFKKLKAGFVSYDLCEHPVGVFIMALFKNKLSYGALEYHAYDTRRNNDNYISRTISSVSDSFTNISKLEEDKMAEFLLNEKCDILFDLGGLSIGSKTRLFALRLSPVQITWIGYPGSSVVPEMDYTIVDEMTDPKNFAERFYTEKLIHMDKTFLCFPLDSDESFYVKEAPFIKNGYVTFGTFNNMKKYTDRTLDLWARVLNAVPNARFYVKCPSIKNEEDVEKFKERLSKHGFDLSRVDFHMRSLYVAYLQSYNEVDIVLDTYPFAGATTTCDAFGMGVPVVSLCGTRHQSRVGYQMLTTVGLPDLVAHTDEQFVDIAVSLANDSERLAEIRRTLAETFRKSPLADTVAFKIEFEHKMRDVYINYVIENGYSCEPSDDVNELFEETVMAVNYLKYSAGRGAENQPAHFDKSLDECVKMQLLLCRLLEKVDCGEKSENAKKLVSEYKKAVYGMKRAETHELPEKVDFIMKLLGGVNTHILPFVKKEKKDA